jgi:hypothetical protein
MHPLHILIGKIILGTAMEGCQVILGKDCGGEQNIQLFCNGQAVMATRFCSVDAIVLKDGQVKVIVEIEESDIRPVALSGKLTISAVARHFIHRSEDYPIAPHASFVQVIDTRKLSARSSKLAQCGNLKESIKDMVWASGRRMEYDIFHGDVAEFERAEAQQELRDHLRAACFHFDAIGDSACPNSYLSAAMSDT